MGGWLENVAERFGLTPGMEQLDGEYDLNFRAADGTGPVILKIMRQGCDAAYVGMQVAAIRHAAGADPALPLPEVTGAPREVTDDKGAARIAWVQRALPGRPLGGAAPQSLDLMRDLGRGAGRLSAALRGFDHPLLDRAQKWRLVEGGWIAAHLGLLPE
ncbi:MAG: phosphotransferase, partial [Gemmobacter sp.]|nr:phosphotransferase [Gemmobacter sp.]